MGCWVCVAVVVGCNSVLCWLVWWLSCLGLLVGVGWVVVYYWWLWCCAGHSGWCLFGLVY